jgi:hypothetical protein
MFDGLTLISPDKSDVERDAVCDSWQRNGGTVLRLSRFWEPPPIEPSRVRLYGPDAFCLVVAQILGVKLMSPDDALLATLGQQFLNRNVTLTDLGQVQSFEFPLFVKPVVPKLFRANVYDDAESLSCECKGLETETRLLTSEPVEIVGESRAFVLNGSVATGSMYEGAGNIDEAISIANTVASTYPLPDTYVVDLAFIRDRGWSILEFNASWGAGLNGCDPEQVVRCLEHATSMS